MKFTVLRENIKNAVFLVEKSTSKRTTLPILSTILCSAQKGKVLLTATNLETAVEVAVGGKITEEGSVALPAHVLSSYISLIGGEQVSFEAKKEHVEIRTEKGNTIIHGYPADDFPLIPRQEERVRFSVSAGGFSNALRRTVFAASTSDIKPEIASVYCSVSGTKMVVAATDSFRLAEDCIEGSYNQKDPYTFLLPSQGAGELIRLLDGEDGDVTISLGTGQLAAYSQRFRLVSRLTEGVFPDYKRIIPSSFTTEVFTTKEALLEVLRVAGLFVNKLQDVTFLIHPSKNRLEVRTANSGVGENTSGVEARVKGEKIEIHFNYRYIMEGLQHVSGDLLLSFTSASGPCVIREVHDPSYFYIVMPMKV